MKYRKKPVVIDALQWRATEMFIKDVLDFFGSLDTNGTKGIGKKNGDLIIHTLEGDMTVSDGDYIIRGVKGELYPCKPDIFEATYEPVEDEFDWDSVVNHARYMLEEYKKIPTGVFGATMIAQTITRYDRGERTKELYKELESIE